MLSLTLPTDWCWVFSLFVKYATHVSVFDMFTDSKTIHIYRLTGCYYTICSSQRMKFPCIIKQMLHNALAASSFPHLDLIIKNWEVLGCRLWVACNQFVRETFPDMECPVQAVNDQAVSNVKSNLKTASTRLPSHAAQPHASIITDSELHKGSSHGGRSDQDQWWVKKKTGMVKWFTGSLTNESIRV